MSLTGINHVLESISSSNAENSLTEHVKYLPLVLGPKVILQEL